jgi:hypothetical protein
MPQHRAGRFLLYGLVALVVCLLATSIWADFVTPLLDDMSAHSSRLTWEKRAFMAIVTPPAVVLGRHRGGIYTDVAYGFISDGSASHYHPPPGVAALEFLRVGVPFWFVVLASIAETTRLLLRCWPQHQTTPPRIS